MSDLEELLAFQLRAAKIKYEREYRFHPTRKWRFDFACEPNRLAIEVEGGTWAKGRHTSGMGFQGDCTKYNCAVLEGWRVLRFTASDIKSGEALKTIEAALK